MGSHRLLGISGSLRAGSFSTAVLHGLAAKVAPDVVIDVLTLHDIPLYNQDDDTASPPAGVAALRAAIGDADGIVIASPEYNHGMPGVLKNALDWASRPFGKATLTGKPVLIVTSSPAAIGGARAHAQLNETLASIGARTVIRPQAVIPFVRDKIADGKLSDAATLAFLSAGIDDLLREIVRPGAAIREQS